MHGECWVKAQVLVANNFQGDHIVWEYMGGIVCCNAYWVNGFCAREEDAGLQDVVVGDGEYSVVVVQWGKFHNEVHGNSLEGQGTGWCNWEQGWFHRVHVDFVHLAGCTTFDIGSDKVFHVRPPVVGADQGKGVWNSRVSGHVEVMKSVDHPPPKAVVFHNDKGLVFVEAILGVNGEAIAGLEVAEVGEVFLLSINDLLIKSLWCS